ncbi:hypothetical protein [Victivallis sp. Marseille-Q1083]|uniref:hypothetical protein n=1 Tax=Victivallis sp. Marseille-Q1083 TaxID=2717288 RepID=UPI0015884537|nr:hypothetical protein [Victivallis sp. Marseille-Q1083]
MTFDNTAELVAGVGTAVFEVAGTDGRWVVAAPELAGAQIRLRAGGVESPAMVCYGWHTAATASVKAAESGLPLGCFFC